MPSVLFRPATIAVVTAGIERGQNGRFAVVTRRERGRADFMLLRFFQLSLLKTRFPLASRSSRIGSASAPGAEIGQ